MSRKETYERWIEINISHEYYGTGNLPANLRPSAETQLFMCKAGLLFRRMDSRRWVIMRQSDARTAYDISLWADDNIILAFELLPLSEEFFYATEKEQNHAETFFRLVAGSKPGVWGVIELPLNRNTVEQTLTAGIELRCPAKFLEYILIPKYNAEDMPVKIVESKSRILFSDIEKIKVLENITAYRVRSSRRVALSEVNAFRIQLSEVRKTGERLLCDNVPVPRYDEISMTDTEGSITTYFYY